MRTKIAVYIGDGLLVCYIRFLARDRNLLLILSEWFWPEKIYNASALFRGGKTKTPTAR